MQYIPLVPLVSGVNPNFSENFTEGVLSENSVGFEGGAGPFPHAVRQNRGEKVSYLGCINSRRSGSPVDKDHAEWHYGVHF